MEANEGFRAYLVGHPLGGMTSVADAADAYIWIHLKLAEMLGGAFGNFDIALNMVDISCSSQTDLW